MLKHLLLGAALSIALAQPASAHHRHHHWRHHAQHQHNESGRPADCYGIPWCGCWLRHHFGLTNKALNLARNWASMFGHRASGPAPGVVGVKSHHVFLVIRVTGPGRVLAISGNDGHAVRTRERSTRGVIAWRSV